MYHIGDVIKIKVSGMPIRGMPIRLANVLERYTIRLVYNRMRYNYRVYIWGNVISPIQVIRGDEVIEKIEI